MSYRRFNVSTTTQNFTGQTTTARIYGTSVFIGESSRVIEGLAAHIVATCTMTNATFKPVWQGSNDNTTFYDLANGPQAAASVAFLTGATAATKTIGIEAPQSAYGYKYARPGIEFTSTTAGTTNDAAIIGLVYRQLDPGGQ